MFSLFKKKEEGALATFKIDGMHCTSCSMNIDGELEEMPGVLSANTSYSKATTKIVYDDKKVSKQDLKSAIEALKYTAHEVE